MNMRWIGYLRAYAWVLRTYPRRGIARVAVCSWRGHRTKMDMRYGCIRCGVRIPIK